MVETAPVNGPDPVQQRSNSETTRVDRVRLRNAEAVDLGALNALIQSAIDTWELPERVKRVSKPLYHYDELDLQFQQLLIAQADDGDIVGISAWEPADPLDAPAGHSALLLHGIYVAPGLHRQGIGSRLLKAAEEAARSGKFDALLVKVQAGAELFFMARGYEKLPVIDPRRDYPHRYWKKISAEASG